MLKKLSLKRLRTVNNVDKCLECNGSLRIMVSGNTEHFYVVPSLGHTT